MQGRTKVIMNDVEDTYKFVADDWPILSYDLVTCKNRKEFTKLYEFPSSVNGVGLTGKVLLRWQLVKELEEKLSSGSDPRAGLQSATDPSTGQDALSIPLKVPEQFKKLYYIFNSLDCSTKSVGLSPVEASSTAPPLAILSSDAAIAADDNVDSGGAVELAATGDKPLRRGYYRTARNTVRRTLQRALQYILKEMDPSSETPTKKRKASEIDHSEDSSDDAHVVMILSENSSEVDKSLPVTTSSSDRDQPLVQPLQLSSHQSQPLYQDSDDDLSSTTSNNFKCFKTWVKGIVIIHFYMCF